MRNNDFNVYHNNSSRLIQSKFTSNKIKSFTLNRMSEQNEKNSDNNMNQLTMISNRLKRFTLAVRKKCRMHWKPPGWQRCTQYIVSNRKHKYCFIYGIDFLPFEMFRSIIHCCSEEVLDKLQHILCWCGSITYITFMLLPQLHCLTLRFIHFAFAIDASIHSAAL